MARLELRGDLACLPTPSQVLAFQDLFLDLFGTRTCFSQYVYLLLEMLSNAQFALCAVAVALLAPPIQAVPTPSQNKAPTKVLERRDAIASICTQDDTINAADFILYNNLWGEDDATSGSQCTYLDYSNTNSISWQTAWTWKGASDVKSYANAVLNIPATQLSAITSLASTWSWR